MSEPAGVEPALQVLTARQRGFLADGVVPEPTEQQAEEMRVFSELHGPASGADFAWTYAARLLIDHFGPLLADERGSHAMTRQHFTDFSEEWTADSARQRAEIARLTVLLDAAQLARDRAQFAAADAAALLEESRPWWRRLVDRLRAGSP